MSTYQFLSLAPTTSASYPPNPVTKSPVQTSGDKLTDVPAATTEIIVDPKTRRSSSSSSASSNKPRFLKLGPVHYGIGVGGDWSDAAIAE